MLWRQTMRNYFHYESSVLTKNTLLLPISFHYFFSYSSLLFMSGHYYQLILLLKVSCSAYSLDYSVSGQVWTISTSEITTMKTNKWETIFHYERVQCELASSYFFTFICVWSLSLHCCWFNICFVRSSNAIIPFFFRYYSLFFLSSSS